MKGVEQIIVVGGGGCESRAVLWGEGIVKRGKWEGDVMEDMLEGR